MCLKFEQNKAKTAPPFFQTKRSREGNQKNLENGVQTLGTGRKVRAPHGPRLLLTLTPLLQLTFELP
jgi:hypothetical protein